MRRWLWVVCLCIALVGCAGGGEARRDEIPTGAERWQQETLMLPAGAPLVVELRAGELLAGMDNLHSWLVADPAMFGQEGAELTQALRGLREALGQIVGGDALLGVTWASYGVELKRPWTLGMWPISPQALERLNLAEAALAKRLGVQPGPQMADALDARLKQAGEQAQAPVGLYAEAARLVTDMVVVPGVRVALPISDEGKLLGSLDRLMTNMELEIVTAGPGLPAAVRRVYHGGGGDAALVVRVQGKVALIDALWSHDDTLTPTLAASQDIAAGRPAAPRAPGAPALAMSLDQQGMGHLLRWLLYREALERASQAPAAERDAAFLAAWSEGVAGYHQWELGGANITGTSYALTLGSLNDPVMWVQLALYGRRGLELPKAQAGLATLGERAISLALERALIIGAGSGWQRWLKLAEPRRLIDIFDVEDVTDLGGVAFMLALPRNAAILLSNAVALIEAEVPALRLLPLYTQHERFARAEVAAYGDLSGFLAQPRLVGLVTLTPGLKPLERDAASAALRATVEAAAAGQDEQGQPSATPSLKPLVADQIGALDGHPTLAPVRYYYTREGATGWILWGYNLNDEQLLAEVERVKAGEAQAVKAPARLPALSARVEPVALLRAASTYAPQQLSWLDVNILAQRLGALVVRVRAGDDPKAPVLLYEAELERPAP